MWSGGRRPAWAWPSAPDGCSARNLAALQNAACGTGEGSVLKAQVVPQRPEIPSNSTFFLWRCGHRSGNSMGVIPKTFNELRNRAYLKALRKGAGHMGDS